MCLHPTGSLEWQRETLTRAAQSHEASAQRQQAEADEALAGVKKQYPASIYQACADDARYLAVILRAALAGLPSDAECQHQAEGAAMLAARELTPIA